MASLLSTNTVIHQGFYHDGAREISDILGNSRDTLISKAFIEPYVRLNQGLYQSIVTTASYGFSLHPSDDFTPNTLAAEIRDDPHRSDKESAVLSSAQSSSNNHSVLPNKTSKCLSFASSRETTALLKHPITNDRFIIF
jgi:hypothetical protein